MKEVTEWNGKSRYMWVWNDGEIKSKEKVVYISELDEQERVLSVYQDNNKIFSMWYEHCAEIEEETKKETRLTNYELNQLLKCFGVECYANNTYIYNDTMYECENENKEVLINYKIRYKQGEWEEPTRETVWKWWGEELPSSDIADFVTFLDWDKE